MKKSSRVEKLKLAKKIAEELMNRKTKFDETCPLFCSPEAKPTILKQISEMDKKIDSLLTQSKKVFTALSKFDESEIAVIIFCFSSIYSNDIPHVDSRDLHSNILRNSEERLNEVMQSMDNGRLFDLFEKGDYRRSRNSFPIIIRSLVSFEKFLFSE